MAFLLTGFGEPKRRLEQTRTGDDAAQKSVIEVGGLRLDFGPATQISGWETADYSATIPRIALYGWPLSPDNSASWPPDQDSSGRPLSAKDLSDYIARNGFGAVERLRGSFVVVASAVHPAPLDNRPENRSGSRLGNRIDCYRSRAGGRTAYWACRPNGFAISDSAFRVACTQPEPLREDPAWLAEFFMLSSRWSAGISPFEGVRELLPGEHFTIADGKASTRRNALALSLENRPCNIPEWVAAFGRRLDHAVADSLPASRPAAVMLSGGMDSGPVAAIAGDIAKTRNQPLHAVSWRIRSFPESEEWDWISMLARHLGLPLTEIDAENHLPFSSLDASQVEPDNPMYNAFRPLILTCYENARQLGCEVVLNAAGGDALYPHPARALVDDIFRADVRSAMRHLVAILRYYGPLRMHRAIELRGLARALVPRIGPAKRQAPAWLTEHAARQLKPIIPWPPEVLRSLHPDFARQLFGVTASGGVAREVRFGQRYGVDRRDPYLDPDLRALMLQVPHALIHRHGTTKWIAREAMKSRMPEAFRTKPRTGLLSAFFNHGFDRNRQEIRALLMDHRDLWAPWIDPAYLAETLDGKSSAGHPRLVAGTCIGYVLWKQHIGQRRQ